MARLSGGVSSHAFMEAWTDWAFHFGHSPGRQLELAERAQQSALKLMTPRHTGRPERAAAIFAKALRSPI